MARTRSWTDRRDGALWLLRRGFRVEPSSPPLVFIRGAEQRTVLLDRQAELDDLTDEQLEALLDQAQRMRGADG